MCFVKKMTQLYHIDSVHIYYLYGTLKFVSLWESLANKMVKKDIEMFGKGKIIFGLCF